MNGYNVITGDSVSNNSYIITRPATPIEFTQTQLSDSTGIVISWNDHLATGNASTIKYYLTRNSYTVTGIDVSDTVTVKTVTQSAQNYSDITDMSYNIGDLLYEKTFNLNLYSYNQNSTSSRSYGTSSISVTSPSVSDGQSFVSYTLTAEQNPVDYTKLLEPVSYTHLTLPTNREV